MIVFVGLSDIPTGYIWSRRMFFFFFCKLQLQLRALNNWPAGYCVLRDAVLPPYLSAACCNSPQGIWIAIEDRQRIGSVGRWK
jgi:hypothetical protein